MKKKYSLIAFIVILLTGYGLSKYALDQRVAQRKTEFDIRYLPLPKIANILSFGYKTALADFYWVSGVNYYGSELTKKSRTYKYLSAYCDLIVSLDPYFNMFYDWAGTAFIYNALPVNRERILDSTRYVNAGIRNLDSIYRYDTKIILKGAFNYALEAQYPSPGLPYFMMAARSFRDQRDMLLVASTYAASTKHFDLAAELKLEYLGELAFEAQNKEDIRYAIQVAASSRMNTMAAQFIQQLRIGMERDEDMRKLVEAKLAENPILQKEILADSSFTEDPRMANILKVDFSRTWLPTEMLVLFSL